jgi:hypothetical protein
MKPIHEERMHVNPRRFATRRNLVIGGAVLAVIAGGGASLAANSTVFDPKAERDAFQAAVAKKLGVTTKQLQDAYKAAAIERVDATVAAGRITKEQGDALKARIESRDGLGPMGFGFGFGHGMPGMPFARGDRLAAAADYLGLTEAQLRDKLAAGQSLADVAKAQGKSVDGLKQALLADEKNALDQAVRDGEITTAQRDAILARADARIDALINGSRPSGHPFRRGFGFRFGPGMKPGFDSGYQSSSGTF